MIPYAIFGAELNISGGRLDLCAAEISVEGFTFRILRDYPEDRILNGERLSLRFSEPGREDHRLEFLPGTEKAESCPEPEQLPVFAIAVDESEENDELAGSVCRYRVRIDHPDYRREVNSLMAAWSGYVRGKMAGDDGELARRMTGYPAEQEHHFPQNRAEQRRRQMEEIRKQVSGGSRPMLTPDRSGQEP